MSIQQDKLKAIADAIRQKEGSSGRIPAKDFPARILALDTGGGAPPGSEIEVLSWQQDRMKYIGRLLLSGMAFLDISPEITIVEGIPYAADEIL